MDTHTAALLQRAADDESTLHLGGLAEVPFGQLRKGLLRNCLKLSSTSAGKSILTRMISTFSWSSSRSSGESLPTLPVTLGDLTDYAMTLRYEDDGQLPPPLDRRACIDAVELLRVHVTGRIQALNPPPPPTAATGSPTVTP